MRSLRPYYLDVATTYDAIMVHAGGSDQAYSDLKTLHWNNIDGVRGPGADAFARDPNRMAHGIEHSLFTTGQKILDTTAALNYRTEHEEEDYYFVGWYNEFIRRVWEDKPEDFMVFMTTLSFEEKTNMDYRRKKAVMDKEIYKEKLLDQRERYASLKERYQNLRSRYVELRDVYNSMLSVRTKRFIYRVIGGKDDEGESEGDIDEP